MASEAPTADTTQADTCDLCGLPVEVDDFELSTTSGIKHFCCEGCFGIFQMLHEDEIVRANSSG
ncbi:MAG: metal-binding protein [Gammaproteobacteria bacterium]|nr:metal-binding protein [Gammaproteobacteria bacterium]